MHMALSTTTHESLPLESPVPFSYATVLNDTIIHEYIAISSLCTGKSRTLWSIILSCVTTLFACAWTAIHPNMSGPLEGRVVVGVRRLTLMVLTLGVPELIVAWALRQLYAARMVQKRFEQALQGGTLEVRVKPYCEPRLVSARAPRDANEVTITIPEEVTESWSEKLASLCSSISATFHRTSPHVHERPGSSSMPVQSIQGYCRWTLKHSFYAWMGGFMLFVDKDPALPREIYHPLTPDELFVFLEADLVQMSMVSEKDLDDRSKGDWLSKTFAVWQLAWFVIQLAARASEKLPTTPLEVDTLAISILSCFTYASWWNKPKDAQSPISVYWKEPGELPKIKYSVPEDIKELVGQYGIKRSWIADHIFDIFRPVLNLGGMENVSVAAVEAHRVPSFCGYLPVVDIETFNETLPVFVFGALTGMVFGVVHCIAWDFAFSTHTEQVLWRMASITMAVTPGFALVVAAYIHLTTVGTTIPHVNTLGRASLVVVALYTICRLIAGVLMLFNLRSLPAGVYDEVCWTSLIPHV